MSKKEDKKRFLLTLVTILFIVALISFLISISGYFNFPLETKSFYTSVNVTLGEAGVDLDNSALKFGKLTIPASSTRNFIFTHSYDFPVETIISAKGSISQLIKFEKRIIIDVNESKKIAFTIITINSTIPGYYDGKITFKIYPLE